MVQLSVKYRAVRWTELRPRLCLILGYRQENMVCLPLCLRVCWHVTRANTERERERDTSALLRCGPGCRGWIEAPKVTRRKQGTTRTERNKLAVESCSCCVPRLCRGTLEGGVWLQGVVAKKRTCFATSFSVLNVNNLDGTFELTERSGHFLSLYVNKKMCI